ncbi:Protein lev-9 [Hypsibius exemplaris]|uniref:Protein lev-9 n=1 Tax=Hypsibius exemplaris TaxID=2072580 RepID=A0A1W0X3Z7_HYPEX|nr:Protein lev-9 [Hypsibius exemplaris]
MAIRTPRAPLATAAAVAVVVLCLLILDCSAVSGTPRFRGLSQFETAAHETIRLCPRNLDKVDTGYRKCLRPCIQDGDCKGRKKKCLCDGDCGMSCVKPNTKCAALNDPPNGKVHTTGIEAFGSKVFYTCHPDYKLRGPRARSCQGDATWSGDVPVCQPDVKCEDPPEIPHAQHNADYRHHQYELDTMIQYTCESGYAIEGFARAKCIYFNGTAKWFGPDLRCVPRNCGKPEDIANGYREGDHFAYPHHVKFHCYPGYNLIGKSIRHCQRNGKWDGENPLCKAVECLRPLDPHNGFAVVTSLKYEAVVTYTCKPGYHVARKEERRCQANQTWSGPEPKCEVVNCGPPDPIINGGYNGSLFTYNSVVFFYCNKGSKFVGMANSAKCQTNGNWSHAAPKCFASCTLPYVEHGSVSGSGGDRIVSHGDLLNVTCIPKYELSYSLIAPMCHNGSFLYIPSCHPASCKVPPPSPRKGLVIAPKTDHGMKARFVCGKGYRIQGDETATCEYGNWTGQAPTCQDIFCPWPGKLTNGTIYLVGAMGSYEYYDYIKTVVQDRQIRYECQKGYFLHGGPVGATCIDGNWSPLEKPKCHPGLHPPQSLFGPRVRRAAALLEGTQPKGRTFVSAPCNGLKSEHFEQSNVLRDTEDASHYIATFKCRAGFIANVPDGTATCRHGAWKPRKPECVPLTCRVPEAMNGGFKLNLNQTIAPWTELENGASIHFSCIAGYQVSGPDRLLCSTGQLIPPTIPECVPASCHLIEIPHGSYTGGYRAGLQVSHNAIIGFHCADGYRKLPQAIVRCELGRFQPETPECVAADPSESPPMSETTLRPDSSDIKAKISATTGGGACTIPEALPNMVVYQQGNVRLNFSDPSVRETVFSENTELLFHCTHLGLFQLTGSSRVACVNGVWNEPLPVCLSLLDVAGHDLLNMPPAIYYHKSAGITGLSPLGELLVYPSTDLQLDCVWRRSDGTPSWLVSHQFRLYPKGWANGHDETAVDQQQPQNYRLSLYHAVKDDSGSFTCITPRGKVHSVTIKVQIVECPLITPTEPRLIANTTSTRMGTFVAFNCTAGYWLSGPSCLECLPTGRWSQDAPTCSPVLCPPINASDETGLRAYSTAREPGSVVEFACATGYQLKGVGSVRCEESGHWSTMLPQCEEITCSAPKLPENGALLKSTDVYNFGDTVEYSCEPGYALIGATFATCLDNGLWSDDPKCVPSCNYPGHPSNGRVVAPSVLKFHYDVGENINFGCATGYTLSGSQNMTCLKEGRWSNSLPLCLVG